MSELSTESALPQQLQNVSAGRYEARLARTSQEVLQAQRLRYQVMYLEKGGHPDLNKIRLKADVDEWDECAHHIIVLDNKAVDSPDEHKIVGTLRLVSNETLTAGQHFYTEEAFDLAKLRDRYTRLLELGRFCIDPTGRNGAILMLIWKYAMQFIMANDIEVMFGCASFPGTDIDSHRDVLSYLYNHNLAPEALMPHPVGKHIRIADIRAGHAASRAGQANFDDATQGIPTLLRGYLKLGARTSDCAVIDPVFNTTFICIYVDAASMLSGNTTLVPSKKSAVKHP